MFLISWTFSLCACDSCKIQFVSLSLTHWKQDSSSNSLCQEKLT